MRKFSIVLLLFTVMFEATGQAGKKECKQKIEESIAKQDNLKVIGAGGFGSVYEISQNTVIKALRKKVSCGEALSEYKIHQHIYAKLGEFLKSIVPKIKKLVLRILKNLLLSSAILMSLNPKPFALKVLK